MSTTELDHKEKWVLSVTVDSGDEIFFGPDNFWVTDIRDAIQYKNHRKVERVINKLPGPFRQFCKVKEVPKELRR